jgi:transcriptional regulator with XRE-family HTH domain
VSTVHDDRYHALVERLREIREARDLTQQDVAARLGIGWQQPDVSKVESCERRLDVVELFDWFAALDQDPQQFFRDLGWFPAVVVEQGDNPDKQVEVEKIPALPIPGGVEPNPKGAGVLQHLDWQGRIFKIQLDGITEAQYLDVESAIMKIFTSVANRLPVEVEGKPPVKLKNREAICLALQLAVERLPDLNPSDIYQHIVYRLFLRQTRSGQSWVRSGGEAVELFIERHYAPLLAPYGIRIAALFSAPKKREALNAMGLVGKVGNSKLDIVLYGQHKDKWHIFGAVHSKASLAERVTDDEPASKAMMDRGFESYLWTFDSKSYPPPSGDLVNYGELGTPEKPSDKREYVENHGSFSACFSYNTRGTGSKPRTKSGRLIYVSSLKRPGDPFPEVVRGAWLEFSSRISTKRSR